MQAIECKPPCTGRVPIGVSGTAMGMSRREARNRPMMWIVRLALRRPYTFVVFALLILILGIFSIETMPTDIFPNIDIPIVTVVWGYNGLSAEQMADRIVSNSERGMTTTVNDIEHIESQSLNGDRDHQGVLPAARERRPGAWRRLRPSARCSCAACLRERRRPSSSSTTLPACPF